MEHKATLGISIKDAGGRWEVEGYASTFGDPPDFQNDVVMPGAFRDSIRTKQTKLLYNHDQLIGGEIELKEDAHGLFGRWFLSKTALGTEVHQLALDKALDSFSIGYQVIDATHRRDGVRELRTLALHEVSLVPFPANPNARVTAAKGYGARRGRTRSEQEGLDLAVRLEIMRRKLVARGVIMGNGPHAIHLEMIRRRIAMRQRGIVPPTTSYGRSYRR